MLFVTFHVMPVVRMHMDSAEALADSYSSAADRVHDAMAELSPLVTEALALLDMPGQNPVYGPMPALNETAAGLDDDKRDVAWRIDLLRSTDGLRLDAIRLGELNDAIDNWNGTDNDPLFDALLRERRELLDQYVGTGSPIPPAIAVQLLPHLTVSQSVAIEREQPATFDISYLNAVIGEHDAAFFLGDPVSPDIEHLRDLRDALVASYADGVDGRPDNTIAAIAQRNGITFEQAQLAVEVNEIDRLNDQILGVPSTQAASATRVQRDDLLVEFLDGDLALAATVGRFMNQGNTLGQALDLASQQSANINQEEEGGYFEDMPGGFQVSDVAAGLRDAAIDGVEGIWDLAGGVWNFASTAVTNPGQMDDMFREQVDNVSEVVGLITSEIEAGNWDTVVVELLLPILGIEEELISERGLDYGIGYAIAANPEILVAGGGLMIKLAGGISDLRTAGRLNGPNHNRSTADINARNTTSTPEININLAVTRIDDLDIGNLDLNVLGSDFVQPPRPSRADSERIEFTDSGQEATITNGHQDFSVAGPVVGDELNGRHNTIRGEEPYWGAADEPRVDTHEPFTSPEHWIADVNGEGNHLPGRNNNCLDCTRAVEVRWRGGSGTASPLVDVDAEGLSSWEPILQNLQNGRVTRTSESGIAQQLTDLGEGSSAQIVVRWRGRGSGHAFNAVNDGGIIRWVDGQEGQVAGWPPPYAVHATDWQAIIVDPAGNPVGG